MQGELDRWFVDEDSDSYRWICGDRNGTVRRLWKSGMKGVGWSRSDLPYEPPAGLKEALDFYWPEEPRPQGYSVGEVFTTQSSSGFEGRTWGHHIVNGVLWNWVKGQEPGTVYRRLIRMNIEPFIDPVPWTKAHTAGPVPAGLTEALDNYWPEVSRG